MTKSIEDYPELKGWVTENVDVVCNSIGENCFHFFHYEPTAQKLLEMQATIDAQQERIKYLESISTYHFLHPKTGDKKTVEINRQFIIDRLIDELYEEIECNCKKGYEVSSLECDCNEYFEEFEIVDELNKESK